MSVEISESGQWGIVAEDAIEIPFSLPNLLRNQPKPAGATTSVISDAGIGYNTPIFSRSSLMHLTGD
jgi:hypothetical protein